MNKLCLSFILCLIFLSCQSEKKDLHLLTDDIYLYQIVDQFNARNDKVKVKLEYISLKNGHLFQQFKPDQMNQYDIIAGHYHPRYPLDVKDLPEIKVKEIFSAKAEKNYYPFFYQFYHSYLKKAVLYSFDFPVIISLNKDENEDDKQYSIDFKTFQKKSQLYNQNDPQSPPRIAFIPSISYLDMLDYFLIFNAVLIEENDQYTFNTPSTRQTYQFYYHFNDNYFSKHEVKDYLKKYHKIPRHLYLKKNIIQFEVINFSKQHSFPDTDVKTTFIKNLNYISLNKKIAVLGKNSRNKKEARQFIQHLLDQKSQKMLFSESYHTAPIYNGLHLPVVKTIIDQSGLLKNLNTNFDHYLSQLNEINFYNQQIRQNFFTAYGYTQEMINREMIKHENFLSFLSDQLNK